MVQATYKYFNSPELLRSFAGDLHLNILQTLYFNEHIRIIENNFFSLLNSFITQLIFFKKQPLSKKPINKQFQCKSILGTH